jgi:hypothetical protein
VIPSGIFSNVNEGRRTSTFCYRKQRVGEIPGSHR